MDSTTTPNRPNPLMLYQPDYQENKRCEDCGASWFFHFPKPAAWSNKTVGMNILFCAICGKPHHLQ
jgi:hypothetical protein